MCPILEAYVLDSSVCSVLLLSIDPGGVVGVCPILEAYVLDSIASIFLGRRLNALAGSPDGLSLIASTKYIEKNLLRYVRTMQKNNLE